jgi:hypothetical protein
MIIALIYCLVDLLQHFRIDSVVFLAGQRDILPLRAKKLCCLRFRRLQDFSHWRCESSRPRQKGSKPRIRTRSVEERGRTAVRSAVKSFSASLRAAQTGEMPSLNGLRQYSTSSWRRHRCPGPFDGAMQANRRGSSRSR